MPVFLPLLCFVLLAVPMQPAQESAFSFAQWRSHLLRAALIWGLLVTLITELLSAVHQIALLPLCAAWSGACLVVAILRFRYHSNRPVLPPFRDLANSLALNERIVVIVLGVLLAGTGVNAILAAPCNYDVMTYHLGRVVHWEQARSVEFFPTHNLREILFAPWAEYALLHFQILSGGDRYANLLQWFGFGGCLLAISAIAAHFGASRPMQMLAALLAATLPIALLEASSAQNDLILSFWILYFVFGILRLIEGNGNLCPVAEAGAALGLAVFTKGTAFVFAPPFLLWYLVRGLRERRTQTLRELAVIGGIVCLINAAHASRKIALYGGLSGLVQEQKVYRLSNEAHTPAALASSVIRNAAMHFGTPQQEGSRRIEQWVEEVHHHLGISASDPRTTFMVGHFAVPYGSGTRSDDHAGDPLQLLVFGAASIWYLFVGRRRSPVLTQYSTVTLLSAVFFCAVLKWQPWNIRLHLTWFLLTAPLLPCLWTTPPQQKALFAFGMLAFLMSPLYLLGAQSRVLIGRNPIWKMPRSRQYFANAEDLCVPWQQTVGFLQKQHWTRIGLSLDWDGYDYPFWIDLQRLGMEEVQHVGVSNPSGRLELKEPFAAFAPQAVVTVTAAQDVRFAVACPHWNRVWTCQIFSVYTPDIGFPTAFSPERKGRP